MSVITDMVIVAGFDEADAMVRLNAWCETNDPRRQRFLPLDMSLAGGNKVPTANVWAMAGNHFPWWDLAEAFGSFGWTSSEDVVLIVYPEGGDDGAEVVRASERKIMGEE